MEFHILLLKSLIRSYEDIQVSVTQHPPLSKMELDIFPIFSLHALNIVCEGDSCLPTETLYVFQLKAIPILYEGDTLKR